MAEYVAVCARFSGYFWRKFTKLYGPLERLADKDPRIAELCSRIDLSSAGNWSNLTDHFLTHLFQLGKNIWLRYQHSFVCIWSVSVLAHDVLSRVRPFSAGHSTHGGICVQFNFEVTFVEQILFDDSGGTGPPFVYSCLPCCVQQLWATINTSATAFISIRSAHWITLCAGLDCRKGDTFCLCCLWHSRFYAGCTNGFVGDRFRSGITAGFTSPALCTYLHKWNELIAAWKLYESGGLRSLVFLVTSLMCVTLCLIRRQLPGKDVCSVWNGVRLCQRPFWSDWSQEYLTFVISFLFFPSNIAVVYWNQ